MLAKPLSIFQDKCRLGSIVSFRSQKHVLFQSFHDVILVVQLGDIHGRLAVVVAKRHRRAVFNQKLDEINAAVTGGVVHGRVLVLIHRVHIGTLLAKKFGALDFAVAAREVKTSAPFGILHVGILASLQEFNESVVITFGRSREHGLFFVIDGFFFLLFLFLFSVGAGAGAKDWNDVTHRGVDLFQNLRIVPVFHHRLRTTGFDLLHNLAHFRIFLQLFHLPLHLFSRLGVVHRPHHRLHLRILHHLFTELLRHLHKRRVLHNSLHRFHRRLLIHTRHTSARHARHHPHPRRHPRRHTAHTRW
mmetsp:Transcript_853/g.3164  ORF Transcript_853/g.3164 Transcript_853/m.3164 type:complete len:303 (-) Transcript_853:239-1147(-)